MSQESAYAFSCKAGDESERTRRYDKKKMWNVP